jgi:hypothetical protein
LAGLLATCYEMISEDVIREELGLPEPARDQPHDDDDQG